MPYFELWQYRWEGAIYEDDRRNSCKLLLNQEFQAAVLHFVALAPIYQYHVEYGVKCPHVPGASLIIDKVLSKVSFTYQMVFKALKKNLNSNLRWWSNTKKSRKVVKSWKNRRKYVWKMKAKVTVKNKWLTKLKQRQKGQDNLKEISLKLFLWLNFGGNFMRKKHGV